MEKKQVSMKPYLQTQPNVFLSFTGLNGEISVLAVSYCNYCSKNPPMLAVGIISSCYSYKMIKESGCFVLNLVKEEYEGTSECLWNHNICGINKTTKMNIKMNEGIKVKAPILDNCHVNIECKVVNDIVTDSHKMFVGRVEYIHGDNKIVDDKGNIDFSSINFL